ncbi:mycofactocin biosynthesis chaperone MftB [Nocardia higoensis]|uniref:Mycofactocin biosynthesis chaperone MftB n=1 Tax=Nocardia higoensis TaxID=228599 RepID=A0ABS0D3J7_9NOCA|nr:mycofactocin biosynthesis chaperone MftB [Nocardia higoensis]MBF6353065.1 mycofactocin biosynthesis chaperone MftB [Nocardia higoensis]
MDALLGEPWTLSPSVALRPEPFGALLYHFGNRKLTFLKRPELVAVVRGLGDAPDVRTALDNAGVPPSQHAAFAAALRTLAAGDMIRPRREQAAQ